jgi:hypothetical protein
MIPQGGTMAVLRASVALLACAAAFGSAACDVSVKDGEFNVGIASGRAEDEWKRDYAISAGGLLDIRNINGQIAIEPAAEGAQVQIRALRIARAGSDDAASELLKQVQIEENVTPDAVRLQTKAPSASGWGKGHEVKYFVKAPPSIRVNAHTTNGGIRLAGLRNDLDVSSVNGGIDGERLSGPVKASTTNGGVDVQVDAVPSGGVRLSTVNGGISLELPQAARADISARVTNGGLHTDNLTLDVQEQSRRRLEGKLNGGGSRVELVTTNGGIRIRGQ